MRNLAFDFLHDPDVYNISDQYMFGPAFMICPVTQAMLYGPGSKELQNVSRTRDVYLPKGTDWYDFWTGKKYKGGQQISAHAPIEIMPIFVKDGSIIPMGVVKQYVHEAEDEPIELKIYAGQDAAFSLYEDEGDGYAYENGEYSIIDFEWRDLNKTLIISGRKGIYKGMQENRIFKVLVISGPNASGNKNACINYDGTEQRCKL